MLQDHVKDSIEVLADLEGNGVNFDEAYHQLKRLTRATCEVCGLDFEAELAAARERASEKELLAFESELE